MIALVLAAAVEKREGDLATVLTMAVCAMTVTAALTALSPVLSFLYRLEDIGHLEGGILGILLKVLGVGLVTETGSLICSDGGSNAMGRTLQLLGCCVMLRLSLPVMDSMLMLIQKILEEV